MLRAHPVPLTYACTQQRQRQQKHPPCMPPAAAHTSAARCRSSSSVLTRARKEGAAAEQQVKWAVGCVHCCHTLEQRLKAPVGLARKQHLHHGSRRRGPLGLQGEGRAAGVGRRQERRQERRRQRWQQGAAHGTAVSASAQIALSWTTSAAAGLRAHAAQGGGEVRPLGAASHRVALCQVTVDPSTCSRHACKRRWLRPATGLEPLLA